MMIREPGRGLLQFWFGLFLLCALLAFCGSAHGQDRANIAYWESLRVSPPCTVTEIGDDKITIATAEGKRVWLKVLNVTAETLVLDRLTQSITPVSPKILKRKQVVIVIYREHEAVEVHIWKL